jgi:hypothetical protein
MKEGTPAKDEQVRRSVNASIASVEFSFRFTRVAR